MIIFVIPTYNEVDNIVHLLNNTHQAMTRKNLAYKAIVVDDGSTDNTAKVVESLKTKLPVDIYSHYPNKGVGEAFRVGFSKAINISKDGDIIVTKEADNTSDLTILDQLIFKINHGYDLVLASCYSKEGAVIGSPMSRRILSKAANILLKFFIPLKDIHTYSSFYRAYSSSSLKQMYKLYGNNLITENGFECMVELLIKFSRDAKFKIAEVPMILDGSKRLGRSKMRVFKTAIGFLRVIFKESVLYNLKGTKQNA